MIQRGGAVLLAAQHYEVLGRQLEANERRIAFWPRPLFPDVDRLYLEGLGIELVREVLTCFRDPTRVLLL